MPNIRSNCEPRQDILAGTFNPEIFTASLSEVMRFYREKHQGLHPIYTDAEQFFTQGTYPTEGFKMLLAEVFARLAGDAAAPAIHRLETAFGGGKTHTLIACAHIGYKGSALASCLGGIIDARWLPEPGAIQVLGIAGNEIPVHQPSGDRLIPYTLWGEIAHQVGGEALYRQIQDDAAGYAAPGRNYFDTVFGTRKILLMIDELAQYSARLSAARRDGSAQLAAFLMSLHEYARAASNIAVVLTLAGARDAFARQTGELTKLLAGITGRALDQDEALEIGQKAVEGISSVVARDATSVVPVQASEISRVLSRRLFTRIDDVAAQQTAEHYMEMYQKNASLLPDEANRAEFRARLISHYPFHPTFIDFLNHKLATYENFQGTRGVLRVLALAVRRLWRQEADIPMIHTCHLDLRDARTVNEVIGRTGSADLLMVLNADVGGADTVDLTGAKSNAELADRKNPHPQGWPLFEYTWKTIFLHSLVGRDQGLSARIFGLVSQDALFEISFPGLTPPQISKALEEINQSAYYLRFDQGRYFASLDPSINIVLAGLRRSLTATSVDNLLEATARKVLRADVSAFAIVHDVAAPEHIPDKAGRPCIALISLLAASVEIKSFITTAGASRPRLEQNHVLLLAPDTVEAKTGEVQDTLELGNSPSPAGRRLEDLRDLARTVLAMRELKKNPQNYGINPPKLAEIEFVQRHKERENALNARVTESYRSLWYPSASGQIVCREIRTAGGEGGLPVMEQIRTALTDNSELVTRAHTTQSALASLKKLFFQQQDVVTLARLRENFQCIRNWPILETPDVFDLLIRAGVPRGAWCLFRMGDAQNLLPEQYFSRETGELPLDLNLRESWSLVTPEGARQRGWGKTGVDPQRLREYVREVIFEIHEATVGQLCEKVAEKHGEMPEEKMLRAIAQLVLDDRIFASKRELKPGADADFIHGATASLYMPDVADHIITPAKAAEKGLIKKTDPTFRLAGAAGAQTIIPLLRRIGSIYQQGGKSRVDVLDLVDMHLPAGGKLRLLVENAPLESMRDLGELFETLDSLVRCDEKTECYLTIEQPATDCAFIQALKKNTKPPESS